MHPLEKAEKKLTSVIRMDLQLHFFWSFFLTLPGIFWEPLLVTGIIITIVKEIFDVVAEKGWSWGDFWWGIAGALAAFYFIFKLLPGAF